MDFIKRMQVQFFIFFLIAARLSLQTAGDKGLVLCVVENNHTSEMIRNNLCPKMTNMSRGGLKCIVRNDRFGCLRRLTIGGADFTVLEPEDLVAAAAYKEYNILITNEIRLFSQVKQHFEMVTVAHKDIKTISDLRGRRFCHPGLDTSDDGSKSFSAYLEHYVIPNECDTNKTLLENRVMALSNYFEAACLAGPWSPDVSLDVRLKRKYRNLCAACDNPDGCYSSDKYHGREGALLCLTDNMGDIAWVRLDDTQKHFEAEGINKEDYNYLCPDGTSRPIGSEKPCIWITKPWPVIVARASIAEAVENMINHGLEDDRRGAASVMRKMVETFDSTLVGVDTLETPDDYLRKFPGFASANNRATCHPSRRIKWCIASNLEDRKCRWLREASFVYGVEPAISCILEASRAACMEAVRTQQADIFVVKPDELIAARKKNLKPILQAIPGKKEKLNRIAAVVKQDSRFKSLRDLKGAKACFTGYRDIGWNAFVTIVRNITGESWCNSDANIVSDFFTESCVLGLNDIFNKVPSNLYSLCKQGGRAGDDVSTFDCLTSGLGDVAFVNLKAIEGKTGSLTKIRDGDKKGDYRILCVNERDHVHENTCLLAWTTLSTVVAHKNTTTLRHEEIYSALLEMDQLFGHPHKEETHAFSLYGIFDLEHNVIFPEETTHLQFEDHEIKGIRNYDDIAKDIVKHSTCGAADNWKFLTGRTVFPYILATIVLNKLMYNVL